MESLPLPALSADPAPPPPAPRPASEDRGFADALRAAHADDAHQRKPASGDDATAKPRRDSHHVQRRKAQGHDDSDQNAAVAPAAPATPQTVSENKPAGGTTTEPSAPPAADTTATDLPGIAGGQTADGANASAAGTDATPQTIGMQDFATAIGDADRNAETAGIGAGATGGKDDAAKIADKGDSDKPSKDKPHGDTAATPTTPAVAVPIAAQAATQQSTAQADDDPSAATTQIAATGGQDARSATPLAAATAPAATSKADGTKAPAAAEAADGGGVASQGATDDATQAAKPGDAEQVADDKGKAVADSARKSDAVKDKKALTADGAGQQKAGDADRASSHAVDAAAAPRPAEAAARADTTAHQAAGRDAKSDTTQNATTTPTPGFLHDLRTQSQLSTQQTQASTANATPRLPTPPADQVAVQIGRAVQQGRDHLSVELHPADLGRISVDLQLGSDQRVVAVIHADHHDTLQLLQRDSHTLHRALQDAGLQTDSGSLSFNLRGEGGGSQQSFAQFSGKSRPIAVRMPVAAAESAAQLVRPLRYGDSGIDIRV